MKILLVTARFPAAGMKGDQIRGLDIVELLSGEHEVTVLTGARPPSEAAERELAALARVERVHVHAGHRLAGAAVAGLRGRPHELGWMTPRAVARALERACREHDLTIACTIRCLPRPPAGVTILDHVDALSASLRERSRFESHRSLRVAALLESRLLAAHERRAARWVAAQIVVSPTDAAALPQTPRPLVLPLVCRAECSDREWDRDIDVVLSGDMRYPPNRDAARWLADDITPAVRQRRPAVRVVVAGRSADTLSLAGVEVISDHPDLRAVLRRSRVAAVPLRGGTGVPNKLLEATAEGAAAVTTPWVARAAGIDVEVAGDTSEFATAIDRLLSNEELRAARVAAARAALEDRRPEVVRQTLNALIARVTSSKSTSGGLSRACPLCGHAWARPIWNESGHRYVRCVDCQVVFSDLAADTYGREGRNAWDEADLDDRTDSFYGAARGLAHRRFLESFAPYGRGRLLDVGCGLGYFVQAAREAGWEAYGCDVSPFWGERARARIGPERFALSPPVPGLFGGHFDLITAWDVLEHIHDPLPFLRVLAGLLGAGGRLFIRTPNLTWIYPTYLVRRLLGEQVELGPLNHVVYYTSRTLTGALRRSGLEPIAWPVLPPPQVGLGNRDTAPRGTLVLKNLHSTAAQTVARRTRGRLAVGADLDVLAEPTKHR